MFPRNKRKFREAILWVAWFLLFLAYGLTTSGCSALQPSTKSQSMTVTALGFPAITVVTTTSQAATNSGDDEGENHQTVTNDLKPNIETSVVP